MSVSVKDTDKGYAALVDRLYGASQTKPVVRVGILATEGGESHGDKGGGTTILDVAIWNEFGTERIPERSFLRAWFDENKDVVRDKFRILMKSVVRGERTKDDILDLIGLWCVGEIQQRMASGVGPDNAQSTIDAKGSSTPLIDTGLLRSAISFLVEDA